MKKLLVTTDFTEFSEIALESAVSIANQTGSELILLHINNLNLEQEDDSYENYYNMPGAKTIVDNVHHKLDGLLTSFKILDATIIYQQTIEIYKTILKTSDDYNVDLIIMGAYGKSGSENHRIGSNTANVMLHAKMPVLIVKEKLKSFNIENTVLASEFFGEAYNVFPKMKMVLDLFNTRIHLLKVNTPSYFRTTENTMLLMEKFVREFDIKNSTKNIYNDLSIEQGILNFSKSINADLIAITPDGIWKWSDIFTKNITNKILKNSPIAILSMKSLQPQLNAPL